MCLVVDAQPLNHYAASGLNIIQNNAKKQKNDRNPGTWVSTHLTVLGESFPINTNIRGFRWFSKILSHCSLDESSLSIGWVKKDGPKFSGKLRRALSGMYSKICGK